MRKSIKRVLYAPNIHQGGGKVLLTPLLEILGNDPYCLLVLDERIGWAGAADAAATVRMVKPTLTARLWNEVALCKWVGRDTMILCMGNLPPLLAPSGRKTVFLQNWYLASRAQLSGFPPLTTLRIVIERLWLRFRLKRRDRIVVQTQTMKKHVEANLGRPAEVVPFCDREGIVKTRASLASREKVYDFLYVASGEPHKNHRVLVQAWRLLAARGVFPRLCLTLGMQRNTELTQWIKAQIEEAGLNIELVGDELDHRQVLELYGQARAFIYPSLFESFGLPLIEAAEFGMPIVASDRAYVAEVVASFSSFDPQSALSVANAVEQVDFSRASEPRGIATPEGFLEAVF